MLAVLPLLAFLPQAQSAPSPPQVDVAQAKRVFDNNCAGCHGPEGAGGKGPPLAVPKLRQARTDNELMGVIFGGIPGTQMPPSWHLGMPGVTLAAAYVRILGARATPAKVEGDVAKGQALYQGKGGCANCHTQGAAGRAFGPDLSGIGARRSAASLRESLTDPGAEVDEGFLPIHAVTSQGTKIDGIRLNEDTFTIQILDQAGRLHSLRKSEISQLEKRADESPMPSYKTVFSETEMQDLMAYLSSLRGEQ
jgi:cytochrome c oxidase cbb3-type subunit 3